MTNNTITPLAYFLTYRTIKGFDIGCFTTQITNPKKTIGLANFSSRLFVWRTLEVR